MSVAVFVPDKPFWGARIVQIPFLQALREKFPRSEVRLHAPVAEAREFIAWGLADSVREYRRSGRPPDFLGALADLRAARSDAVFNLRRKSTGCSLVTALAGGRRTGYDEGPFSRFLDDAVPYDSGIYMSARYLSLLENGARGGRDDRSIPLFRSWMEAQLPRRQAPRRVLFLVSGSREGKKWPLESFLRIVPSVEEAARAKVAFVLGPRERAEGDRLRGEGVEVLDSPPLPERLARIDASPLVVANDCGPSHLAQLSGRRFLGIYVPRFGAPADWFLDKENSDLVVAEDGRGLESVEPEHVLDRAVALLETADYADSLRRFSRAETPIAARS